MIKVFLVILMSHSSIGHLNSKGVQAAISYVEFASMQECEAMQPVMEADAASRLRGWGTSRDRPEFTVASECKTFEASKR